MIAERCKVCGHLHVARRRGDGEDARASGCWSARTLLAQQAAARAAEARAEAAGFVRADGSDCSDALETGGAVDEWDGSFRDAAAEMVEKLDRLGLVRWAPTRVSDLNEPVREPWVPLWAVAIYARDDASWRARRRPLLARLADEPLAVRLFVGHGIAHSVERALGPRVDGRPAYDPDARRAARREFDQDMRQARARILGSRAAAAPQNGAGSP